MTFRTVVREVALSQGIWATFMPKPFTEHPGSGMHTHVSLFEGDQNAFYEAGSEYQLSKVGRQFIAGILAHARGSLGRVRLGNSGRGSFTHLVAVALENRAGVKLTHVPFGRELARMGGTAGSPHGPPSLSSSHHSSALCRARHVGRGGERPQADFAA